MPCTGRSRPTRSAFTAQGPEALAELLARDGRTILEQAWEKRYGHPVIAFEDRDPVTLQALLFYWDDAFKAHRIGVDMRRDATPRRRRDWETPILTGDPVVDAWERQVAAGQRPDYDRG